MKKRITAFVMTLTLLLSFAVFAQAEEKDLTEETNADPTLSDVVIEELPGEAVTGEEEDVIAEEECLSASDTLVEENSLGESHAGSGVYEGKTEWLEEAEDEDALQGYVQMRLNRERGLLQSSFFSGRRLVASEPGQASVYFLLKDGAERVADGERTTTIFGGPISELTAYGLIEKTKFYTAELGYETVDESNRREVAEAMLERMNLKGITAAMRALLADCPYELYWFDKTSSGGYKYSFQYEYDRDESGAYFIEATDFTIRLAAAQKYAADRYEVTTEYADSVNAAIQNARDIAEAAAYYSDTGKLEYYLEQICLFTSYNSAAVHGGLPYGDPWQIIYVFDGDPSTKVVCEGYAKAFAYLCELSRFEENVEWYIVTGKTPEQHMWNIVSLNGNNYLVDPTNCDDGAIGQGKQLFLVGYDSGSVEDGYRFICQTGTMTYHYDTTTLNSFDKAELNLVPRGTDPRTPVKDGLTLDSDGVWRYYDRNLFVPITGLVGYNGRSFYVVNGVLAGKTNGLTLIDGIWYFLAKGQLQTVTQWAEYDGYWFYITEGILDTTKNGLMPYNGGEFLVAAGQIKKDVSGLWLNEVALGGDGSWYYLSNGQVQNQYTGLAQYDGEWFYVIDGMLAGTFIGIVEYNGSSFYIVNGMLAKDYTGIVEYQGTRYQVEKGVVTGEVPEPE